MHWQILLATLRTIATSGCITLAGVAAAWHGHITPQGRKCLAELSMNVLMPALLFTDVVACQGDLTPCVPWAALLEDGWILLVAPAVIVPSGLLLGRLTAAATRCPRDFANGCTGAVAFANSTGMSISLLGLLGPALLQSEVLDKDPQDFQPLYLVLYPVLQWSIGSWLFGLPLDGGEAEAVKPAAPARHPTGTPCTAAKHFEDRSMVADTACAPCEASPCPSPTAGGATPGLPERAGSPGRLEGTSTAADTDEEQPSGTGTTATCQCSSLGDKVSAPAVPSTMWLLRVRASAVARNVLRPPVCGALLGIAVALAHPVREVLDGERPYLGSIFQSLEVLGKCSVPTNMLVLGAGLAQGANFRSVPLRTNLGIAMMKMLCQPLLMTGVIYLLARVVPCNKAVWVVVMVMSSTPTANNIILMTELSGENKESMRACILLQYVLAPLLLSGVLTGFLTLLSTPGYLP